MAPVCAGSQCKQSRNPANTKPKAIVQRLKINDKQKQIDRAIKFCKDNNCRGWKAISSGLFPGIKHPRTINNRLDGKVIHGEEKEHCSILTTNEENIVVDYIVAKSRCYQPLNRSETQTVIISLLKLRDKVNKKFKGGRKYIRLSKPAVSALRNNRVNPRFWTRFDSKHADRLSRKKEQTSSVKRALACTEQMAREHLDDFAEEAVASGIFENAAQLESGVWTGDLDTTRIFNCDETPQFIDYGSEGCAPILVYSEKGKECKSLRGENRLSVTVNPIVSFAGEKIQCQIIFPGQQITSHMAPHEIVEKIPTCLVSTTGSGCQDGKSFLPFLKVFNEELERRKVQKPVILSCDGHASRFDLEVLTFCKDNDIRLFLSPPETTAVTQLLDQINSSIHSCYRAEKVKMFEGSHSVSKEGFMLIMGEVWQKWADKKAITNAAKRVGVTSKGFDVNSMQTNRFAMAEALEMGQPAEQKPVWTAPSPDCRKNSRDYWKEKCMHLQTKVKELSESPITPDEVPGLLPQKKITRKDSKSQRITSVHGSLLTTDIIERVSELREKQDALEKRRKDKLEKKDQDLAAFLKCKEKCSCSSESCQASGLRQCPECRQVLHSQCMKIKCKINGQKPNMILPKCDLDKTSKSTRRSQTSRAKRTLFQNDDTESEAENVQADLCEEINTDESESLSLENPEATMIDVNEFYACFYPNKSGKLTDNGFFIGKTLENDGLDVQMEWMQVNSYSDWEFSWCKPRHIEMIDPAFFFAGPLTVEGTAWKGYKVKEIKEVISLYKQVQIKYKLTR